MGLFEKIKKPLGSYTNKDLATMSDADFNSLLQRTVRELNYTERSGHKSITANIDMIKFDENGIEIKGKINDFSQGLNTKLGEKVSFYISRSELNIYINEDSLLIFFDSNRTLHAEIQFPETFFNPSNN